jgi:hypothetical protein
MVRHCLEAAGVARAGSARRCRGYGGMLRQERAVAGRVQWGATLTWRRFWGAACACG